MTTIIHDNQKSVYELVKVMQGAKHFLKWRSDGLAQFLVLFSADAETICLQKAETAKAFSDGFEGCIDELIASRSCVIKRLGIRCMLFSRNEMMRDGGMMIKETPGNYAVYGIDYENAAQPTIYIEKPEAPQNLFTMTLDVPVEQSPVMVEKGFFKKTLVFSGYHKVVLKKAFPELKGGVLMYTLDEYKYPFPNEIVENGGTFYVKADQHATIRFESKNRGVQIK